MKHLRWLAPTLLALSIASCSAAPRPRNVILLIGDGMGFAQTSLARLSFGKPDAALNMDAMRYAAMVKTQSSGPGALYGVITDSAAAATALATANKTKNGMLGVLPTGAAVTSIVEAAMGAGKAVGLVTTVTITHATPAGFGAHESARGDEDAIAPQYLDRKIDVLMGGGEAFFLPKSAKGSKRKDERDLLAEARSKGYTVVRSAAELAAARTQRLLGLFNMSYMTTEAPEPSVADMTVKALEALSARKKGFFLMVEGGQIDSFCHANNAPGALKQTLDFDAAVGKALEFARKNPDTLVIVTADHETGGMAIVGPATGSTGEYSVAFGTKGHSATVVPLLADGPCAERFSGVLDNTDIPKRIAALWGLKVGQLIPAAAK